MASKTSRSRDKYATKLERRLALAGEKVAFKASHIRDLRAIERERRLAKGRRRSSRKALVASVEYLEREVESKAIWSLPATDLLICFCKHALLLLNWALDDVANGKHYQARVLQLFRTIMKRKKLIFPAGWPGIRHLQTAFLEWTFTFLRSQRPAMSDPAMNAIEIAAEIDRLIAAEQSSIEEAINFWRVNGIIDQLLNEIWTEFKRLERRENPGVPALSGDSELRGDECEDSAEYIKSLIDAKHAELSLVYEGYFEALTNLGDFYRNRTNDLLWDETTSMVEILERINNKRAKHWMTVGDAELTYQAKRTLERWSENAL